MLTIWLVKMLGKKAFSICESASKSHCVSLQVASLLYVLHHGAFHVAFQHIHHSHGDANCGGSAPGTSECWGGAWCHQYYRQHHYWRKRVNRYLPVLVFFFFLIYQWPESLIYTIQILSRSELFDLYCQIYWSILFLFAWSYFFQKWKTVLPWNVAEAQTHALWLSHACPFYSCPSKLPSSEQVPEKISSGLVRALGVSDVPRKKEFGKKKISHFFQFTDSRLNNDII